MLNNTDIHTKLRELRETHNYTQSDIAKHLGLSRQAIHQWETGKSYPDVDNIVLLCKLYGISSDELLGMASETQASQGSTSSEEKEKASDSENMLSPILEMIGLTLILFFSTQIPFLSIPVSIIIAIWIKRSERNYKIIYVLCVVCLLAGIFNTYSFLDFFADFGSGNIEIIE